MSGTLSGTQYVGSGSGNSGSDSGTTIKGGLQEVGYDFGTGTATSTTISGGAQRVGDNNGTGTATSTVIFGGTQTVGLRSGTGTATGTTISGGVQEVGRRDGTGTVTSTTIGSGGRQLVGYDSGTGTAISTTILSGGVQNLGNAGGTGSAIDTTISNGGAQYVGSDFPGGGPAAATRTTILSGGVQEVGTFGAAGTATSTTIDSGGTQYVGDSGGTGTATDTIISGGVQRVGVYDGTGTAIRTTILSGGLQELGTFVQFGGGTGTAISTTIGAGGIQDVGGGDSDSGTAISTTILSGGIQYLAFFGGNGTATSTTISGGQQYVAFDGGNGTATDTTILSGGQQILGYDQFTNSQSIGTATRTTISGGGTQYVGHGGVGMATSTTVLSGGVQDVGGNGGAGTATSTTLNGGTQYVGAGGTATGTIVHSGGLEEVLSGGVANAPVIDGGTLRLDAGASIGSGPIDFSGANGGTLDLTGEGTGSAFQNNFSAAISGFSGSGTAATSDIIDVTGSGQAGDHLDWKQDTATQGRLIVEDAGNHVLATITLDGAFDLNRFVLTANASVDHIAYNTSIPCYCRGTLIRTAGGDRKVEELSIGDEVWTASSALRPIKWIGRRSYAGRFVMGRKDILPVCFKAGALADNVPARDLWISPHHAMFLDGVLIEARDLINGVSIVQAAQVDQVEYFHVELDTHDVIIAEGALSESFIDDDSRGMFHNAHEHDMLYPEQRAAPARYCAPRLDEGYEVEAVRQRLALRAGLLRPADAPRVGALRGYIDRVGAAGIAGWAQNIEAPDAPVCLDILAHGKLVGRVLANGYRSDLEQAGVGHGRHGFEFTPPAGMVLAPAVIEVRRSLDGALLQVWADARGPTASRGKPAARRDALATHRPRIEAPRRASYP